jgi:photosystem II stability/assembly factor-like uncharacterized protein
MRKTYLISLLFLCFLTTNAQWTQFTSSNLEGGNLSGMLTLNGVLYIASEGGVFKTADNGQTWNTVNNGFNNTLHCQIAKLGDTLFSFHAGKVKKLVNNVWVPTPMIHLPQNSFNSWVNDIGFANNKLFTIVQSNGQMKLFSSNDGKSWNDSVYIAPASGNNFRLYSMSDKYIYILNDYHNDSLFYSNSGLKIKKIRNVGLSAPVNYDNKDLTCLPIKDTLYHISKTDNKIYKYYESDSSWHALALTGLPTTGQVMSLSASDDYIFVGYYGLGVELYRSSDYGATCSNISNPIPGYPFPIFEYIIHTGGTGVLNQYMAFHAFGDFYYSGNNGDQWTKRNNGFLSLDCSQLAKSGSSIFTQHNIYGVIRSNDQGNTWNYTNTGLPNFYTLYSPELIFDHRDNAMLFYAKSINNDSLDLFKFNNGSSSWIIENSAPKLRSASLAGETDSLSFIFSDNPSAKYYTYSSSMVSKWKDISASVSNMNLSVNYGFGGKGNDSIFAFGRNNLYKKKIYLSNDTAGSWSATKWPDSLNEYMVQYESWGGQNHPRAAIAVGGPEKRVIVMARDFTNFMNFNSILFYMFRASDSTWVNITPSGIANSQFLTATYFAHYNNEWFLFTTAGVFKSIDYCQTWTPFKNSQNYPTLEPYNMRVVNNEMFLGTRGSSMWKAVGSIGVSEKTTNDDLTVVYPNPTKGNLTIEFKDVLDQPAYIKVYKSAGNLVFSGKYQHVKSVHLDLSDFDAGVYFIKITNGDLVSNQKVMLVK